MAEFSRKLNLQLPAISADKLDGAIDIAYHDASPRLVIAIDFGTYASGYALQWRTDFTRDRLAIHFNKRWAAEGFCTHKTPTCLLLKPDKSIAEFGYQAETKFASLGADDDGDTPENTSKPEDWYFFRHFKMLLYKSENVTETTPVEATHGKRLPVLEVFSKSIQYMKDHAINHLKQSGLVYPEAETKWVITVPAIWNDSAKRVMRKAAENAGIIDDNLTIALEPECAAIYCSQIPVDQLEIEGDKGKLKYVAAPGSTIMVVDMGGGTVDITTVQVNADATMKQVYMSGGGAWGGMKVDEKFMIMLRDMVGGEVMAEFAEKYRADEYDLRMEFESKKREVKHPSEPNSNERFRVKLPSTLKELWEAKMDFKVTDILRKREDLKNVKFMSGRLSFDVKKIREFFQESISSVLKYVNEVLSSPEHEGLTIDSLILVGGFSESNLVVQSIRDGLKDRGIPVVRPQSTEMAVLNGAVLFGQNEEILTSRIMRYTYGVGMIMEYDKAKHREEKRYEERDKFWATDVFRKHVTRGQEVKLGQWVSDKEYYPVDDDQQSATVYMYASDQKDPIHTDDPGCRYVGQLEVKFSDPTDVSADGRPKRMKAVEVSMNFGGTEVKVKAKDKTIGKVFQKCLKLQ